MKAAERVVRRSVLDRLCQDEPEPRTEAESIRALKAAVLRDVEWLLNTRRIITPAPAHLTELQESVYHYGLPDISSLRSDAPADRRDLARAVAECIECFEPRLANVRVNESTGEEHGRQLRFQVHATLRLPVPEPIYFDTLLDPSCGRFSLPVAG